MIAASCFPFFQAWGAALYSDGEIEFRWDNTLRYSTAIRLDKADPVLLADRNADDGDRSFKPGIVSNRFDLFSQLDISKGDFGFDASAALWYDTVYHQKNDNDSPGTFNPISVPHDEFTHAVRDLHGQKAELVNAFLYGSTDVAGMPLSFRVGRHTLLWGESLFFPDNGIAAGQGPVDETKVFGRPTAYAKDVFMPVTQASASLQISGGLALDAYYQFEWRKTRLPGVASYFSTADDLDAGGERYILRPGQYLFRDRDLAPPNSGQYGAALHWSIGQIDYGAYALRFHAKDPQVYYRPGIVVGSGSPPTIIVPSIVNLSIGKVGTYNLVYPQGIEIYGISASGYLGSSNIAGEISGRRNMPLVSTTLIEAPGQAADGDRHPLYAVGNSLHAQISTITNFSRSAIWDAATLSVEVAANSRLRITKNPAVFDRSADGVAVALRSSFEPTYFAVLPNLDLTPSFGVGYDVAGDSSTDSYQTRGGGDFEFGVTATYRVVWSGSITLSHFFGSVYRQPLADRDLIGFSIQRTF
jgi:hypothetical protein